MIGGVIGALVAVHLINEQQTDKNKQFFEIKDKYENKYRKEHKIKNEEEAKKMLDFINEVTGANKNAKNK